MRAIARKLLPHGLRVELLRLANRPRQMLERRIFSRSQLAVADCQGFDHVLAEHRSPLRRDHAVDEEMQAGKEHNVTLAASLLDRVAMAPNQLFSYHHLVGRPSERRGFRPGLELRDGKLARGIGGGCCQVSNLLYMLALLGGMKIVERHRHGLDLFPDHARTVPFGCGATVFFSYADLRLENPLDQPVLLRLEIDDGHLRGRLLAGQDPGWTVQVYQSAHRFFRQDDHWMRENRVRRRFVRHDGGELYDHEVAHNLARVLYEPEPAPSPAHVLAEPVVATAAKVA